VGEGGRKEIGLDGWRCGDGVRRCAAMHLDGERWSLGLNGDARLEKGRCYGSMFSHVLPKQLQVSNRVVCNANGIVTGAHRR
jgi:hypothetical protein